MTTLADHVDDVLMHTLGLNERNVKPCRNYFIADPGHHDSRALDEAEQLGLMRKGSPGGVPLPAGSQRWYCTAAGEKRAIEVREKRYPPLTRAQRTYRAYLDGPGDWGITFGDFLRSGGAKNT